MGSQGNPAVEVHINERGDVRVDSEYPISDVGVCWRCQTRIARDKIGWFHQRLVRVGDPCAGNAEPELEQVSI